MSATKFSQFNYIATLAAVHLEEVKSSAIAYAENQKNAVAAAPTPNTMSGPISNVPEGDFAPGRPFVIKNITDDAFELEIRLANQDDFVTTQIYPGWNPELIVEIHDVVADTLQWGY